MPVRPRIFLRQGYSMQAPAPAAKPFEVLGQIDRALQEIQRLYLDFTAGIAEIKKAQEFFASAKQGQPGKNGRDGKNGSVLARGISGRNGKDGISPSPELVVQELMATSTFHRLVEKRLKDSTKNIPGTDALVMMVAEMMAQRQIPLGRINGIEARFAELKNHIRSAAAWRGGGDTVVAGSGIAISNTVNGNKQITATGSGAALTQETPTGTVNGSNVTFTVLHTPVYIIVDGLIRPLVANIANIGGNGFTYSAPTVTVGALVPPVEYIRSYYNA